MALTQATTGFPLAIDSKFNNCVLIDKPTGITTFDIIRKLRKIIGGDIKIGHGGTLDPFASGLVIILTGQYTKLQSYIQHFQKGYKGKIELGYETDTLDIEGKIIKSSKGEIPDRIEKDKIESYVLSLKEQTVPKFSAVKVNGVPMYKMARKNIPVEPRKKTIEIYSFSITGYEKPFISFDITVSGGTYIRSIARAVGELISVPATLIELRRTSIVNVSIDKAVILDELREKGDIEKNAVNIEEILQMPTYSVDKDSLVKIKNGRDITYSGNGNESDKLLLKCNDVVIAVGKITDKNTLHPEKVLI